MRTAPLPRYSHPDDVMTKCLCWYEPDAKPKISVGELDAVEPDLPGRIDLCRFLDFPDYTPLGRASRLLASEAHLREFQLHALSPLVFVPSANVYKRFVDELLSSNLCTVNRHALGFAKFFTVEKKVSDEGVPILRTILDCQRANEIFIEPDPTWRRLPIWWKR
eukprot:PhM_4_TR14266/c0_g1_i1/m.59655